jgi:hypothetical protein
VTQNVTNYQGLPPLISPNTKQEISPLPQPMKRPPVHELDMCATSTERYTLAHTHTYGPQHVTACSVVVRFLLITLSVTKTKKKSLNACIAHARSLSFLCTSRSTLLTSSPVGAVSAQGYVRCWSRYVCVCVCVCVCVYIYITHTKTNDGS